MFSSEIMILVFNIILYYSSRRHYPDESNTNYGTDFESKDSTCNDGEKDYVASQRNGHGKASIHISAPGKYKVGTFRFTACWNVPVYRLLH
jgi:hypothetical protein